MTALKTPSGTPNKTEKHKCEPGQLGGDRNARQNFLDCRLLRYVGVAEVAARKTAHPLHVLHDDRPIEAELFFELCFLGDIDHAGCIENDVGDVARHQPQHYENQHGNPEQRQEHQKEAPDQISPQSRLPSLKGNGARYDGARHMSPSLIYPSRGPRSGSRYRRCCS